MKNDIEKYTYRIEWSEDDHCHVARCLEFPSLSSHGDTIEEERYLTVGISVAGRCLMVAHTDSGSNPYHQRTGTDQKGT